MCLNLRCYQFKTGAICEPHSNYKQKLIINTQKKMKESKQNRQKATKPQERRDREEERNRSN